jgi:hypothetical protein
MKNTIKKIALVGSALLISTSLTSAQTTVTGNIDIGLKAYTTDSTKAQSNRNMTKESQLNLQTKGSLPNGMSYAAGMSLEMDGQDIGAIGSHTENNYINIISGSTTLSFSADHMPNGNYTMTNLVGALADIDDVVEGVGNTAAASMLDTHGANGSFGIGIIQDFGIAKASYFYAPSGTNSPLNNDGSAATTALSGAANSFHEATLRGNFGVKGLDLGFVYNVSDSQQTVATVNNDVTNYLIAAKYTLPMGIAIAAEHSEAESAAYVTTKTRALGLGYAINKDLTVGYQIARTDVSTVNTTEEKIQGIQVGYNLGPVALQGTVAKVDNIGTPATGTTGRDGKAAHVTASVKF